MLTRKLFFQLWKVLFSYTRWKYEKLSEKLNDLLLHMNSCPWWLNLACMGVEVSTNNSNKQWILQTTFSVEWDVIPHVFACKAHDFDHLSMIKCRKSVKNYRQQVHTPRHIRYCCHRYQMLPKFLFPVREIYYSFRNDKRPITMDTFVSFICKYLKL